MLEASPCSGSHSWASYAQDFSLCNASWAMMAQKSALNFVFVPPNSTFRRLGAQIKKRFNIWSHCPSSSGVLCTLLDVNTLPESGIAVAVMGRVSLPR